MADCTYQRCVQRKRYIRRELQRWTKNMVYIVGLERIAEELMGRRKWKLYQESMSRNYLQPINNNVEKIRTNDEFGKQLNQRELVTAFVDEDERTKVCKIGNDADLRVTTTADGDLFPGPALPDQDDDVIKDWTPETKCYFCVDGKLDSENHSAHGAVNLQSPRHSDSDLSDSPSDSEAPPTLTPPANNHRIPHGGSPAIPTLDSVTSMAALAAVAALAGPPGGPATPPLSYPIFHPSWYLAANVGRAFPTDVVEKTVATAGEQPLDLSAKPATSAAAAPNPNDTRMAATLRLPLDTKHIFKAKPRMSAVAGRRTYTEDELQAALRDIQSGKLGTRRAAVLYGIPRSTLRNKVYKLAMERERESHLNPSTPLKLDDDEVMDDDKELSGAEEEKEVEKALRAPLLSPADIVRLFSIQNQEVLKAVLHKSKELPEMWGNLEHSEMAPIIQNLLMASANQQPSQPFEPDPLQMDLVKRIIGEDYFRKEKHLQNNGESDRISRSSPSNSIASKPDRGKSESDMETDESPSNVILKIPSFKPTTSKNGGDYCRSSSDSATIASPPVTSECGSPPILPALPGRVMSLKDVKDVIAKSISQKFQQTPDPPPLRMPPMIEMEFKRNYTSQMPLDPLKNQILPRPFQHQSQPPPPKPPQNSSNNPTGGKGTRPKRGKYRNYDRDSLVEAVRAVQRGEMSVHRAGSYYGVPHSTLEYKVKERHLMRPRKRDPKPNPVDEKLASLKQNDMRNAAAAAASMDKMKPGMKPPPQPKFSPTSPNGMKLPMFDHNMAPLGYNAAPPYPFWPHPSFPHIPLEYRTPPPSTFPPNPDQFFVASQMMQKLQEDSVRTHSNLNQPSGSGSPASLPKSTRQIAESLLDGSGSKGSFLDGIIRSSLESGVPINEDKSQKDEKNVAPENMSNKALLDQLCRNSRLTPLPKPNTIDCNNIGDEGYRRTSPPSPLNFSGSGKEDKSDRENSEVHTIELSNDSNASSSEKLSKGGGGGGSVDEERKQQQTPPGRIYLKQELTKPENLKPEMLVRFRDVLQDVERNGIGDPATGSASESDVAQD